MDNKDIEYVYHGWATAQPHRQNRSWIRMYNKDTGYVYHGRATAQPHRQCAFPKKITNNMHFTFGK